MQKYAKAWVALSGVIVMAVAQGLIPEPWAAWASIVIAAITAAGVFAVPNSTGATFRGGFIAHDGGSLVIGDSVDGYSVDDRGGE